MTQKISISKILSLFFLTYSLNYCKKDSCCEECCDCLYSEEIANDPSGKVLLIKKKNGNIVVRLETLQSPIDNIIDVIKGNKITNTLLCGASILTEPNNIKGYEDMKGKVENIFNNKNNPDFKNLNFNELNPIEKRSIGSMLGMGIGDAYGAIFEFKPVNSDLYDADKYVDYNEKFNSKIAWKWSKKSTLRCGWTDDSSMGLCLADSLIVNNGLFKPRDIMNRFLAWWYCGYNNASMYQTKHSGSWGLGGNISASFENYISNPVEYTTAGDKYTSGNGSIMRNAAIPIAYHKDLTLAMEYAEKQSKVTHQGHEAAGCCRLLTYIVWNILNEKNNDNFNNGLKGYLDEILLEENVNKLNLVTDSVKELALSKEDVKIYGEGNSKENWNWKDKIFKYNESKRPHGSNYLGAYAMDNMAMSLHILYHTTSFEQAINVATHLGGDADSVASVVGQIAGAFYGVENIPANWIKKLYVFDHGDFTLKALLLVHLSGEES